MKTTSGILLLDKGAGPTSFDVVQRVRRLCGVRKVGHLGTLDPFATGLLPVCVGEATKLVPYLGGADKTYLAHLKLGEETDTLDSTGKVVAKSEKLPAVQDIYQAAALFLGEIEQTPPLYSAVHYRGERLYRMARRGEAVEVPPRRVVIHCLEIEAVALPWVTIRVVSSPGTYVRALAADLGKVLGCGAHLVGLRRLAVGAFRVEEALPMCVLDNPENLPLLWGGIIPLAQCLPEAKAVRVGAGDLRRLRQGQVVPAPPNGFEERELVRVVVDDGLAALAEVRQGRNQKVLVPVRVFCGT